MMIGRKEKHTHERMDEQDSGIYRPCILFTKQSWCEVPMQQIHKHCFLGQKNVDTALCKVGFMLGYEAWTHHDEPVCQTALVTEEDDRIGDDRMNEMFDAIRSELETNPEDPPTPDVQKFFDILKASEESLHKHTTVNILTFITCLMAIKSKFTFLNKCTS
jgi:hypothetical protein